VYQVRFYYTVTDLLHSVYSFRQYSTQLLLLDVSNAVNILLLKYHTNITPNWSPNLRIHKLQMTLSDSWLQVTGQVIVSPHLLRAHRFITLPPSGPYV